MKKILFFIFCFFIPLFLLIAFGNLDKGSNYNVHAQYPYPPPVTSTLENSANWEMICDGNIVQSFYSYNSNNETVWKVQCFAYGDGEITPTSMVTETIPYITEIPSPTQTQTLSPTITNTPTFTVTVTQTLLPISTVTETPLPQFTSTPTISTPTNPPPQNLPIIINHNSVDLFEQIPQQYLNLAFQTRFYFVDQSVGGNIYEGINCMNVPYNNALNHCKRWNHTGIPSYSVDPAILYWNGFYPSNNVTYQYWDNIGVNCTNSINQMFGCFLNRIEEIKGQYDIVSFQVSYLQVDGSNNWIMNYFQNINQLEQWESNNPNKKVIYWTTSLSRGIGTPISEQFNNQMREYAIQNNKVLFDVADILSHDPQGNPCYDNRDGVPYTFGTRSENYPDDGLSIPAICPHYTTEVDGGHLGSVSAGKIRIAKAFWVMLAQMNGWNP